MAIHYYTHRKQLNIVRVILYLEHSLISGLSLRVLSI